MSPRDSKSLRSYRWYGPDDLRSFGHRSRAASMGCTQADYAGKPVIAIINTWGDINRRARKMSSGACGRPGDFL